MRQRQRNYYYIDNIMEARKTLVSELGAGHSETALYEIVPFGVDIPEASVDSLNYQMTGIRPEAFASSEMMTVKFRYKPPEDSVSKLIVLPVDQNALALEETSKDLRFSACVAQFGMLPRNSEFKGNSTYSGVFNMATDSIGGDEGGYRSELLRLIESAELLATSLAGE